jgi:signal transduction histidine kinase
MHASDTGSRNDPMRALVTAFRACRDEVLAEWERRVLVEIPVSTRIGHPILIDTLPILYENLAQALSNGAARPSATSGTNLATMHGRERANLTEYGPQDLIHELQIFRDVVFAVAKANKIALDEGAAQIIGYSIEEATRESMSGYVAANKEVNEAFIASLSHDLRNPLHVANASAQLIQLTTADPNVVRMAKRIGEKLREADVMIQTLLDAAVLKGRMKLKLTLAPFDIMRLVEEVCVDLPLLGQPVRTLGDSIVGHWCRASMKRVLENLIGNAQKYGEASTLITVRVSRIDDRMLLSIHNEGAPIPAGELPRLFTTFQRIEHAGVKGWGLGLPFVQNVAESHGGSIVVDSAEGRGTTFTLSMPIDARPFVNLRRADDPVPPLP